MEVTRQSLAKSGVAIPLSVRVSKLPVAQQMTSAHLGAIAELLQSCSMSAYFNSWCASASVNHFHCHCIDETPPVARIAPSTVRLPSAVPTVAIPVSAEPSRQARPSGT